jgi:SPP1 family predicted phage head-tail adaptor
MPPFVPCGSLRHLLTVQQNTPSVDDSGGPKETWTTFATWRAGMEPETGREYYRLRQIHADMTASFVGHYKAGITTEMRLSLDTRTWNILAVVNESEANRVTRIVARENL